MNAARVKYLAALSRRLKEDEGAGYLNSAAFFGAFGGLLIQDEQDDGGADCQGNLARGGVEQGVEPVFVEEI